MTDRDRIVDEFCHLELGKAPSMSINLKFKGRPKIGFLGLGVQEQAKGNLTQIKLPLNLTDIANTHRLSHLPRVLCDALLRRGRSFKPDTV